MAVDTDTRAGLLKSGEWRVLLVAEAETWLNTPYVPKARVKGVGTDCGGLIYEVYSPWFGPFAPFPTDYSADWSLHGVNSERYLEFIAPFVVAVGAPRKGGITLFHYGLRYAHAAIYNGEGKYIHAWGRLRAGSVSKTSARVMNSFAKDHPPRHFDPLVKLS